MATYSSPHSRLKLKLTGFILGRQRSTLGSCCRRSPICLSFLQFLFHQLDFFLHLPLPVLLAPLDDVQDGEIEQVAGEEEELGDLQRGTGRLSAL